MRTVAAVCVDNDLAPGESAVAVRTADDEPAGGIDQKARITQHLRGQRLAYHALLYVAAKFRHVDVLGVLRGHHDRIYPDRRAVLVDHRDLRLAVRTQIGQQPALAHVGETRGQRVRIRYRRGHQLRSLIARIAEHHALIAGAYRVVAVDAAVLALETAVDAERDVGGLLLYPHLDLTGGAVKALRLVVVAYLERGLADDRLVVDGCRRGDLARQQRKAGVAARLQSDAAVCVLREQRVEDAVRDLVADLVGMTFGHALTCKQTSFHLSPKKAAPKDAAQYILYFKPSCGN